MASIKTAGSHEQLQGENIVSLINTKAIVDFSKCGFCQQRTIDSGIDISGIAQDGSFKNVCYCCREKPSKILAVGISIDVPDSIFNSVMRTLKPKGVDVSAIEKVHKSKRLPYALHIFVDVFESLRDRGDARYE